MARTLATLFFCAAITALSAQATHKDVHITDTEEMKASAQQRMELVDRTVTLNTDQKEQVQQVYMEVERQMAALEIRMKDFNPQYKEEEMKPQYANMDRYVQENLSTILTPEQYKLWQEASK